MSIRCQNRISCLCKICSNFQQTKSFENLKSIYKNQLKILLLITWYEQIVSVLILWEADM
jgi:hypothetical protein